jgi:hypothetical protein
MWEKGYPLVVNGETLGDALLDLYLVRQESLV